MAIGTIAALLAGGGGIASGMMEQRNADKANKQAQEQYEREFAQRAPARLLGMTQLGSVEGAMDLGNLGYDAANPYAAARGPSPSTATYGGWDKMTIAPEQMAAGAAGYAPDEIQRAQAAWDPSVQYLGKSDGAMRFGAPGSTREEQFTNEDRARARTTLDAYNRNVAFMPQTGLQTLGGPQGTPTRPLRGVQPLGGGR